MNYNSSPLKIFLTYYKPHIKYFIADMICAVLIAAIGVLFPITTRTLLNTLIPQGALRLFIGIVVLIAVAYMFRWVCHWFVDYWGHYFGVMVETDMRHDVFSHLEKQGFSGRAVIEVYRKSFGGEEDIIAARKYLEALKW